MANAIETLSYAVAFVAMVIYAFVKYRSSIKRSIYDWLLKAAADAEEAYGGGTGRLKIRYVYERMLETFGSIVACIISLDDLDEMIQDALAQLRHLIETNADIAACVAPKSQVNAIGFQTDDDGYEEDE